MNWIWDSLTWQGKIVLFVGVLVVFAFIGLTFGKKSQGASPPPILVLPTVQPVPAGAAISTPGTFPGQTAPTGSPAAGASPAASASVTATAAVSPTATVPAATATPAGAPPTSTPAPPTATRAPATATPIPPTPTAITATCSAVASVSNAAPTVGSSVTVNGIANCNGASNSGLSMNVTSSSIPLCSTTTGATGTASCNFASPGPARTPITLQVCFTREGQTAFCTTATYTPQ